MKIQKLNLKQKKEGELSNLEKFKDYNGFTVENYLKIRLIHNPLTPTNFLKWMLRVFLIIIVQYAVSTVLLQIRMLETAAAFLRVRCGFEESVRGNAFVVIYLI